MTAFDIYVNGRKVCTAGIPEAGVVTSAITWVAGSDPKEAEDLEFRVGGLVSRTESHVGWFHRSLSVGDEVRVVVTEALRVSKPQKVKSESLAVRRKRKLAFVEHTAKELGLEIVKKEKKDSLLRN